MAEGILIGVALMVVFFAKPLHVFVKELSDENPRIFAYIVLCLVFMFASYLLGWLGFTCVVVSFLLYHMGGGGSLTDKFSPIRDWIVSTWTYFATRHPRPVKVKREDADE